MTQDQQEAEMEQSENRETVVRHCPACGQKADSQFIENGVKARCQNSKCAVTGFDPWNNQ